jgi:SAM-dependent methyltransferase
MKPTTRAKLAAKRLLVPGVKKVRCNFCGQGFIKYEDDHSEKNMCPNCGTVSRERVVCSAILSELGDPEGVFRGNPKLKNLKLIEFSPRSYLERKKIYQNTLEEYLATDFDLSAHTGDRKVDITKEADVKDLSGSFDIAIFTHVLEHIPKYKTAIKNLRRIMSKGGIVVLQVPILEAGYKKVTWDEFHGDNTKVFHRFGFDLADELTKEFEVKVYLGVKDFTITSNEIDPDKYKYFDTHPGMVHQFGRTLMQRYGLGSPDLCEAFVLRAV